MRYLRLYLIALLLVFVAQSSGTRPGVGDLIDNFSLRNIDGEMLDIDSYIDSLGAKGAVVIFTCNTCPYAVATEDRIIALDKKYKTKGYPVIAINPNVPKVAEDSFKKMKKRAKDRGFSFPYLADETQEIARTFGATRTPHVFILHREQPQKLRIRYIGAFDDNPLSAEEVEATYTATALDELLADRPLSKTEVKAIGCSIKWSK